MCQKVTIGIFPPDTTPGITSRDPKTVPEHVFYPVFDDVFYPVFDPVRGPHYTFLTMFSNMFSTRFRMKESIITGYLPCFVPCFWPCLSRKKQFLWWFYHYPRHHFCIIPNGNHRFPYRFAPVLGRKAMNSYDFEAKLTSNRSVNRFSTMFLNRFRNRFRNTGSWPCYWPCFRTRSILPCFLPG